MSQNWTSDSFASGHTGQIDLANMENNFAALRSSFSGSSAPSNPIQGQPWYDTANGLLKIYTGSTWRTIWDVANNRAPAGLVVADSILDGCLTTAKYGANTVTGAKIGLGANGIQNENIKDGTIEESKLASSLTFDRSRMANYACTLFSVSDVEKTSYGTAYNTVYSFPIRFISGEADRVKLIARIKSQLGYNYYARVKLTINGVDSAVAQTTSTSYSLVEVATGIDVSTLNGLYLAEVKLSSSGFSGTAYIIAAAVVNYNS